MKYLIFLCVVVLFASLIWQITALLVCVIRYEKAHKAFDKSNSDCIEALRTENLPLAQSSYDQCEAALEEMKRICK